MRGAHLHGHEWSFSGIIVRFMDVPRSCHRHWVMVPMFLSVLVGSSLLLKHEGQFVRALEAFPNGEDEVLLHDDGMITFRWNDLSLYGMHGAFIVSEQADHVSVAALTTPVLVRGTDTWSIIPIGFQWRSDERNVLLPLPSAFQYAKLQELHDSRSSPPLARWDPSFILPGTLRLPVAKQRHETMVRMQHLAALAHQIARGRSIARMVQDSGMSAALSSGEGYRILPSFLAELRDAPFDRSLLFPFLFQEEEGALLALFHPAFRDHAALLPLSVLSPDVRAAYHLSLPRSDLLPHALSKLAVSRWEEDLMKELPERADSLAFFTTLLATIEYTVRECARHGYVERAERYIAAMRNLTSTVELTPELQERLDDLPSLSVEDPELAEWVAASLSSSASSVTSILPEDLRKRAMMDLTRQGGMFIPTTTIEPLSPTAVRITSLVLATSVGDELLDFTYDTERQEVSNIIRGSTQYPYAVSLQQFVEWVRSE